MAKYLVIVESPAKVKTIKKFLGSNYEVVASQGHVRDMPKSQLGFDETTFEPKYITIRGKKDIITNLRKETKKAEKIYLATDPDREGEAISWHLYELLKLQDKKVYRITFNEITKNAVKESLKNARDIDMDLVDAQQARRMLDRMVGYRISPVIWAKVKRGLSAGRVQSVALRIIADREEEINAFVPKEYWSLDANFNMAKSKKMIASYYGVDDKKGELNSQAEVDAVKKALAKSKFTVSDITKGKRTLKAPLPFTTSTLQQEASKVLGFGTSKTMQIAQQLYEGVDLPGEGTVGIITYLRTDSTRISEEATARAKEYIVAKYGEEYATKVVGSDKKTGKKIQDAHEAIRPTDITRTPDKIKGSLSRDQLRLYQLIWKRFVASQMAPCEFETIAAKITADKYSFRSSGSKVSFDGYRTVYTNDDDEKAEKNEILHSLKKGDVLDFDCFSEEQHFTQPPAHYTEASLVRALEELGIGRPSTYAPTITTIIARHYVIKEKKNLYISEMGEAVNNIMKEAFPVIVDVSFTANMEALLDSVEEGSVDWKTLVSNFYPDLDAAVKEAEAKLEKVKIADEVSDVECDKCGRMMVIKYGRFGKFLACPGFPECSNTKPLLEKTGKSCPNCGNDIIARRTKKGRKYFGCAGYPDCEFMVWKLDEIK